MNYHVCLIFTVIFISVSSVFFCCETMPWLKWIYVHVDKMWGNDKPWLIIFIRTHSCRWSTTRDTLIAFIFHNDDIGTRTIMCQSHFFFLKGMNHTNWTFNQSFLHVYKLYCPHLQAYALLTKIRWYFILSTSTHYINSAIKCVHFPAF